MLAMRMMKMIMWKVGEGGACLYRGPVTRPSQGTALTSSLRHISSLPRHISTTYLFEEGAKIHC